MAPKDKRKEPGMDHPTYDAAAPRGHAPSGGELAGLGVLLVGSANGILVQRSLALGLGFTALSLVRLLLLTGLGLGIGLLIGLSQVWLVVGGIAVAQLVLAGFAVREALTG